MSASYWQKASYILWEGYREKQEYLGITRNYYLPRHRSCYNIFMCTYTLVITLTPELYSNNITSTQKNNMLQCYKTKHNSVCYLIMKMIQMYKKKNIKWKQKTKTIKKCTQSEKLVEVTMTCMLIQQI